MTLFDNENGVIELNNKNKVYTVTITPRESEPTPLTPHRP